MRQRVFPCCRQCARQYLGFRFCGLPTQAGQPDCFGNGLLRRAIVAHHATTDTQSEVRIPLFQPSTWLLYAAIPAAPLARDFGGAITPRSKWRHRGAICHTGSVFQEVPSATRANGSRRQRPLRDILCMQRRLLATGATLVLTWWLGPASRQHLPPAGQLSTSSTPSLPRCACQTVRSLRDHTAGSPAGSKP